MNEKRVCVLGLPYDLERHRLEAYFALAGRITDSSVPMDHGRGHNQGVAFIQFSNESAAETAIRLFDGSTIDGRRVRVRRATPRHRGQHAGGAR